MAAGNNQPQPEDKWLYCAAITTNSNITKDYPQSYQTIKDIVTKEKCKGKTLFTEEKSNLFRNSRGGTCQRETQ